MGNGMVVECRNCRYDKTFYLGWGTLYPDFTDIVGNLPLKKRDEVLDILNNHNGEARSYHYALYVCPRCSTFHEKLYVELGYDSDKIYKTVYDCHGCEYPLEPLGLEDASVIDDFPCPRCKKRTLRHHLIFWD